jgi:hypothetical protein
MTKKIIFIFIISFITSCKKQQEITNFNSSFTLEHKLDTKKNLLEIIINLKPGYHAYAPGELIGKPVALSLSDANATWALIGDLQVPPGRRKKLAGLSESVILEHTIKIIQPIKIGTGAATALLYLQVCTDTSCDRPRTHEIKLKADS